MCTNNGHLASEWPQPSPQSPGGRRQQDPTPGTDPFQTTDRIKLLVLLSKALTKQAKSLASMVKCLQQNK